MATFPNGFYLDVVFSQRYVTVSGNGIFKEALDGGCGILAQNDQSGIILAGSINESASLGVLGYPGDCTRTNAGTVRFSGPPVVVPTSSRTKLDALVQFYFAPGILGQGMGIPITDNFPDPDIGFLPDPDHIPPGFEQQTSDVPEPSELPVLACGLLMVAACVRRRLGLLPRSRV